MKIIFRIYLEKSRKASLRNQLPEGTEEFITAKEVWAVGKKSISGSSQVCDNKGMGHRMNLKESAAAMWAFTQITEP